jgi:hypothetical protein
MLQLLNVKKNIHVTKQVLVCTKHFDVLKNNIQLVLAKVFIWKRIDIVRNRHVPSVKHIKCIVDFMFYKILHISQADYMFNVILYSGVNLLGDETKRKKHS